MAKALLASTASSRGPAFGEAQVQMVNSAGDLLAGNVINMAFGNVALTTFPGTEGSVFGTGEVPITGSGTGANTGFVAPSFILAEDILAGGTGLCWMFGTRVMCQVDSATGSGPGSALATESGNDELTDDALTVMRYVGVGLDTIAVATGQLIPVFFNGWSGFAG